MKRSKITIKEAQIENAITVSQQIPEFENVYQKNEYKNRLKDVKHLILIAYIDDKPVGCKIGYEMQSKQNFYSWMGGVLPKFRKSGVSQLLMVYQEEWVKKHNYERILLKTRKKYLAMIKLLKKNNYYDMGVLPYKPEGETRILYEKKL